MGKVIKKLYQTCDFCKKEYELTRIDRNGQPATLNTIDLPGYSHCVGSMNAPTVISGSICDSCMERLRKILKPHIRLEIFDYGGGSIEQEIEWKEEKPE